MCLLPLVGRKQRHYVMWHGDDLSRKDFSLGMVHVLRGDLLATTVNIQLLKSRVELSPSLCCFIRLALNRMDFRLQVFALTHKRLPIPTAKARGFSALSAKM